ETAVADLYNNGLNATIDVGNYESSGDLNGYWMFDEKTGLLADLSGNNNQLDTNFVVGGWLLNWNDPVTYYIVVDSYSDATNDPPNRFRINVTHHVPPFITGFDLAEDNNYVDITFNKNTYTFDEPWEEGDHSLLIEDFEPSNFQANGGVANPPVINSITNTDGESLQGGELTVRLSLEPNPASGVETFEIKPATSTSIYDGGGTPMADTTNTGEITLNGVAVTIINAILEDDNSYITITFNDTVYSDQATTAPLNINDFELIFNQNAGDGGTATNVTIDSLRSNDGDPLTGGVDIIRIYLSEIDPPPSGAEHILIKPKDNSSIYNKEGVAMPETQTSGEIYLKDKLAPTILTTNLEPSNFISITASERLYKDETGEDEVDQNNFECIIDISAEGSNAETVTINSVVTPDEGSVQYLYNLNLTVNPLPSGVETVYVRPRQDNPIYDGNGNVMSDSTAILTLNDKLPPSLNTASIDESNSFVILTFTEGLYTDSNGNNPVIPNDFTANISIPDNATTASISGLSDLSGAALVGGETLIKLIVAYDQPASGQESMEIKPQENQVFDNAGNAVIGIENDTTFRLNDVLGPSVLFEPGNNSEIHPYNDIFTLTFTEQVRLRLTNENVTNDDILNLITVAYIDGNEETIGFVPDKENDSTFTLDPDTLDQFRHLRVSVQDSVLEDTLDNPVVNQSAIYTVRDITPPIINTELSLINNSNTFVILSFSEGVYSNKDENNDGTGPLQPSDLILVFNPGVDDSVTSIEISDLQRPGFGFLIGGEDSIWVLIDTIGTPNGNETFTIEPNPNDAIYDSSGNQLSPALPPLFSNISEISLNPYPWLDTYSLDDNNGYIDLIFSEAVYSYSSSNTLSAVEPNDFEVKFYPNFPSGGHATDATIDTLTNTNDDPLSGGESEIRVIISISNPPASGYETIVIKPITDFSICNYLGNRLSLSDSTDEITLIDHLAPTITAVSITNTTIVGNSLHGDIEFIASEGIFSNASGTGSINAENFNLAFYQNNGNATDAIIGEVSNFYQGDLTGGEDTVLIGFETERLPSGTEEFAISPATSNSIFDPAGNPMTQTTISERLTLPDKLPPQFVPGSASISSDNSYVIFTLTEGVYGNWETTTPAEPNDFFVEFIPNGGSATGANVAYITNSRQFPLVGGEDTLRCYLDIQGTPSGHERLYIRRDINSTVFDGSGNPLPVNASIWFPDKATDTLQLFDQYHPRASVDTTFIRNRSHISSSIESPINILFNEPIQSFEYTISARH
ncbi:MAG: hypothetical protein NZ811_07875, partial [Gammaproteobacteria bacterium]|nr:hypothetical protein [Gammaproteobacteria bacterium]